MKINCSNVNPRLDSVQYFSQVWGVVCYRVCFSQSLTFCSLPCPSLPSIGKIRKKEKEKREKRKKSKKDKHSASWPIRVYHPIAKRGQTTSTFFPLGKFFIAVFTCAQTLCQYNLSKKHWSVIFLMVLCFNFYVRRSKSWQLNQVPKCSLEDHPVPNTQGKATSTSIFLMMSILWSVVLQISCNGSSFGALCTQLRRQMVET